jgi:hypothetical protein
MLALAAAEFEICETMGYYGNTITVEPYFFLHRESGEVRTGKQVMKI